jgi:ribosomal protein S18 acetylase RimI-like enzyme
MAGCERSRTHDLSLFEARSVAGGSLARDRKDRSMVRRTGTIPSGSIANQGTSEQIEDLLDFLPVLYPGGRNWLQRRLADVEAGRAYSDLRFLNNVLAGLSLGIGKPSGRFKISTLFVAPWARNQGIGASLLDGMIERATRLNASAVYITGASTVRSALEPLLISRGFRLVATEMNRYGKSRDEDVFVLECLVSRTKHADEAKK